MRSGEEPDRTRQDARLADQRLRLLPRHASKNARWTGETERRLYLLNAWHESPLYTERERAALEWTEALTQIAETDAPDGAYEKVRRQFGDKELVNLSTLIGLINLWNRLAIGFRYQHPVEEAR
jgi:alkylhydroperoxidase family enzyme